MGGWATSTDDFPPITDALPDRNHGAQDKILLQRWKAQEWRMRVDW
jgi:hypothetical protein